jgi:hypothetical protein
MIDKKELLNNKDFLKSFKNGEEMSSFFKELHTKKYTQPIQNCDIILNQFILTYLRRKNKTLILSQLFNLHPS